MHITRWLAISVFASTLAMPVLAQQPVIYPAKGQSPEQLEKDKYECYNWAKQSSGFDPMQAQPATSQSQPAQQAQQGPGGQVVAGAAAGAVIGEIASDDAGKGAAIGATVGILARRRQAMRQQQEAAQKQQEAAAKQKAAQQQMAQKLNGYDRAFKACMDGRGYAVN